MNWISPRLQAGSVMVILVGLTPFLRGQGDSRTATLIIRLAPDAQLLVDGERTQQTGAARRFVSPPLAPGREYTYTLRATWRQAGNELQVERRVLFRAGQFLEVDLRTPDPSDQVPAGSFRFVEPEVLGLQQGETRRLTVRIERKEFKEAVKLTFTPDDASLQLVESTIPAGKDTAEVAVTAGNTTPVGERTVQVRATAGSQLQVGRLYVAIKAPPVPPMPPPGLKLNLSAPPLAVQRNRKATITVQVQRIQVEGPVTITVEGLPADVQVPEVIIPADQKEGQLEISAGDLKEGTQKEVRVVATAGQVRTEFRTLVRIEHTPPLVEDYLLKGQLAKGEDAALERLKASPRDDNTRFGLGALQFFRGLERLGQSLYRYGLRSDRGQRANIPFLRLPVPRNPKPDLLTYAATRKILEDLIADLQRAEATLAAIQDEQVKLPLHLGQIRLDFVGDGKPTEPFMRVLEQYLGVPRNRLGNDDLLVVFDRGDVAWLRGYCHLLMALAEVVLAYDAQELFDCAGHVFFANVETPHKFLKTLPEAPGGFLFDLGGADLVDVVAFFHLVRLPVKESARMKVALAHLEKTLALSKESWKYILAETDDDHEWIPNPRQTGALGIRVRQEMIDSWLEFIDEAEALLAGKRLVPFWRGGEQHGVNLRRVFTEPRTFDLVLWVQGTAATPYLEEGPLTKNAVWDRLQRVFGGDFLGFAIWFN